MMMEERIFPDLDALSRAALEELLRVLRDAVAARGRFSIALSGGHTPVKLHTLWANAERFGPRTPWDRVHLFWGDERYVPHDYPLSNYRMARETLINHVPVPAANVHPMLADYHQPEKAAESYESEMKKFFGSAAPAFDLQLMGIGPEGHTASLFPGSPALEETKRWVLAVEAPATPPRRLTLTPAVLNSGRNTFFLVSGADKREIMAALRSEPDPGSSRYPAARIHPPGRVLWFLDQAAAPK